MRLALDMDMRTNPHPCQGNSIASAPSSLTHIPSTGVENETIREYSNHCLPLKPPLPVVREKATHRAGAHAGQTQASETVSRSLETGWQEADRSSVLHGMFSAGKIPQQAVRKPGEHIKLGSYSC